MHMWILCVLTHSITGSILVNSTPHENLRDVCILQAYPGARTCRNSCSRKTAPPIMENRMEKKMENEMETRGI